MPAKSVFISHSSKDDGVVRELRQALEALGIQVWTDSEGLSGGDLLRPGIQKAIEDADYFLLVASFEAFNSEWVHWEIGIAKAVKKTGYKIIPLTRPDVKIPALRLLVGSEPVAIPLGEGPAAIADALPQILA